MQVFQGGHPLAEKEFFDSEAEAFERGEQALSEHPDADEVRITRESPKRRGVGVTRSRGGVSKRERKAQKKARRARR